MKRPLRPRYLTALMLALCLTACGAEGEDAPYSAPPPDCRQVDAYLDDVFALLDAGELTGLRQIIGETIPEDARRDLVGAIVELLAAFEDGTFSALASVVEDKVDGAPEDDSGLQQALGGILRFMVEDAPGAPYLDVMATLRGGLNSCDGAGVFGLLRDVVADDALLRAVVDVLNDETVSGLFASLSFEGAEGRQALTLLLRNLMVSASGPDFQVKTLTDLLGFIVDVEAGPWPGLIAGLERLLAPGPALDALQGALACLLDVDPQVALGPLVYDLLTSDALDLGSLLGAAPPTGEPVLAPALRNVLVTTLDHFADNARGRRALVAVGTELLRDDVAPVALADVAALLDAGALSDVIELLAAVATKRCATP